MNTTITGLIVLVAFAAGFAGICVWALWPSNRKRLQGYGEIPLKEDIDNGQ
jgi:cbb3-type cytochrome oxidase subunit 3